jgi:hypothetical protein
MTETHTQRAHSKLPPSGSERWINCPGSIRLSEGTESVSSSFANEGTAAHELAAHCLKTGFDADRFAGMVIDIRGKEWHEKFLNKGAPADGMHRFEIDDEMVEGVQVYLDHIDGLRAKLDDMEIEIDVEHRFDLTHVHPEMFGTGDCVIYSPKHRSLYVIDLKYGRGVIVDPEENAQLLTYGVGAVKRHHNRPMIAVHLTIVQPRGAGQPVRTWSTDILEVMEFADTLREAAQRTEQADAPLHVGDWCKFCPAAAICPENRRAALAVARAEFSEGAIDVTDPEKMDMAAIAESLKHADVLENWLKRLREYAHAQATAGTMPPGFKLVAKRAIRRWKDEGTVISALRGVFGLDDADIYAEPKLRSPAQVEKVMGKKEVAELGQFIVKQSSGTVLAVESDKRPAVKADASGDFVEVEG